MFSSSTVIWGILFGAVGMGYLIYGKKQQSWVAFISGVELCSFTYFISNTFWLIIVGIALIILPFILRF